MPLPSVCTGAIDVVLMWFPARRIFDSDRSAASKKRTCVWLVRQLRFVTEKVSWYWFPPDAPLPDNRNVPVVANVPLTGMP